jgi:hypothetical protein
VILRLACSGLILAQSEIARCASLQQLRLRDGVRGGTDITDAIALQEVYRRRYGRALMGQIAANDAAPPLEAA